MRVARWPVIGALAALVALALAQPAAAAAPLPTPGTPVASTITTTSITFSWSPSAGPVASYTVQEFETGALSWRVLATTSETAYTHTGLVPDSVYEYRIVANPVDGSGYTASASSGILNVRTAPVPDAVPPTAPGTLYPEVISTIRATIDALTGSTDNHRVAGYWVQRQIDGVWTDWATNNIPTVYLTDLTPGTAYTVVMVAFDANGNRSQPSPPLTFTTRQLEPAPTCTTTVRPVAGFEQATVVIEDMTASTVVSNWTVTFTMPAAQVLSYTFGATLTRTGDQATATPASYYATINPGGQAQIGFFATEPAGSPLPSGFVLTSGAGTFACTAS
ncbi:MAG: fibronectin type III domain-containing protein [Micromonosporaceae bacterium]|nr:fibronectin type III domain-containing protein [Micromonosporaceae bacterium]